MSRRKRRNRNQNLQPDSDKNSDENKSSQIETEDDGAEATFTFKGEVREEEKVNVKVDTESKNLHNQESKQGKSPTDGSKQSENTAMKGENILGNLDFQTLAAQFISELLGTQELKKQSVEWEEKRKMFIAKYNELVDEYDKVVKERDQYKKDADVYKACFENVLHTEDPAIVYREYQREWPPMEKVLFILRKSRKKMTVKQIWQIMEFLEPRLNLQWLNPLHYLSQVLCKAAEYGRVIKEHEKGTMGNFYTFNKSKKTNTNGL